jgi:hypothetical protein
MDITLYIVDYDLILGRPDEVATRVRAKLKEGWELYGEPFMLSPGNNWACQAVVRRSREPLAAKY